MSSTTLPVLRTAAGSEDEDFRLLIGCGAVLHTMRHDDAFSRPMSTMRSRNSTRKRPFQTRKHFVFGLVGAREIRPGP